jgi:mono/diheme cytochrome c family protein
MRALFPLFLLLFSACAAKPDPHPVFAALKRGKDAYYRRCFQCHGAWMDGRGPDGPAPSLRTSKLSRAALAAKTQHIEPLPPGLDIDVALWIKNYSRPRPWTRGKGSLGRRLFRYNCGQCHGYDGRGRGPAYDVLMPPPKDLTASELSPAEMRHTIAAGVAYTAMPAWGKILTAEEISLLENYIRTLPRPSATP